MFFKCIIVRCKFFGHMDTTHKLSVASLLDFQLAFDTQVNLKRKLEENEKLMKDMACHLLNKVGILLNLNMYLSIFIW